MPMLDGGGGGAADFNAVFIGLSGPTLNPVARASWDLAFYNGDKFRIMINHMTGTSAMMTHKTDLNSVKPSEIHLSDLALGQGKGTIEFNR